MKDNYRFYEVNGEEYKIGDWESSEFEKDFPTAKVNMSVNGENYLIGIDERDEFMKDFAGSEVSYTNFGPTRKEERQARREERQNDGKTTFGETLGKSAAAAGVRTGKLALDLARAAWNTGVVGGAINFMTGKKFDEKLQDEDNRITQWSTRLGETADRLSREADPTGGEKGYVDLIKEGNIGQVAQKALASGIESLPMMLAAGSGWGMLLYGAGMAAGEYSDETRENPDIPSWKRAINSMGSAALEMAVEKIGGPLNDLGKAGKEITEDMAKEILETAVKEGSENIAKRIVKKLGTMVKQGAEEGVEEVVTSFGNDVLGTSLDLIDGDADYGIQAQWNQLKEQNPDASLADFAKEKGKEYMDAFIGGAVSGLEISTTTEGLGAGVNALRNNESRNIMQHAREVGSSMTYDNLYDTDSDVANAKTAVANSFADKDGNPTISNEFIESLSAEDAYALAGRDDFSYQQRRAFGELAIAKAKSDALNGRLDTMRDERVATIRSRMEKASENGQIVTGMVDGRVVYVRGGNVNNREVSVDKHGGHGPLLVIDSVTGEEKVVNSKDITSASVLNAEETINGMVNFILNNEASDRQTARTTMSKRAKIAAVNEFIGKRMMINYENGIIEVEVTASPQSGKVLIKGKKGDLGGQAIKPIDADVFYDSIYRNENGEPIFVENGEGETEEVEVEVPETPAAPEAPVAAGVAEEDDFRDFTGTILVDGEPLNVSVISQDGPSDTIVYEYEDENGNTRRASTTIGAFKAAVQQGAEYAPEAPVVPETPVAETPVAEEVPPTEETPTEEEAPVEVELGPDDIDWDALFDSDPEAYFVELQKQFGDGAIDMLTAVVEATQEELDGLNKNKGKTQKEIFANVTKKKELQNKIDILNGMIERLTATPSPETAPEVVPDSVAEPMPEPAPETAPVVETPAPAPVEEPAPDEPVETEPVEEPAPEVVEAPAPAPETTQPTTPETPEAPQADNAPIGGALNRMFEAFKAQVDKIASKANIKDFIGKDETKPAMTGIYHAGGYDYASDSMVLAKLKSNYPSSQEGKMFSVKTGKEITAKVPAYEVPINDALKGYSLEVNIDDIIAYAQTLEEIKKGLGKSTNFYVKIGNSAFRSDIILTAAKLAKQQGLTTVLQRTEANRAMAFTGDNGVILAMPVTGWDPKNLLDITDGKIEVYYPVIKTPTTLKGIQTAKTTLEAILPNLNNAQIQELKDTEGIKLVDGKVFVFFDSKDIDKAMSKSKDAITYAALESIKTNGLEVSLSKDEIATLFPESAKTPESAPESAPVAETPKFEIPSGGFIMEDGYITNPIVIEMPGVEGESNKIYLAEHNGKWGVSQYAVMDNGSSSGSEQNGRVQKEVITYNTPEEAIVGALKYFDFYRKYQKRKSTSAKIDTFMQWIKDTYLKDSGLEVPEVFIPEAPNPVDDPIKEAKKREKSLATQLKRIGIPHEQKQDMAFNAGKAVADFFATREEYEDYAENATDFGEYNADFERGVDFSFANRPQNPDDTPGKSVPLENEPKGEENGGEKDAPKGDGTVRPADGGTGGGATNGGSQAGDKGNPKAIPSQGKGGSEGGKESGKVKHQYPARKGNVTGKILIDTFGLAAVDIPNSRKEILNTFYDFMMEMSKILGISPKSIGNGGWLTLGNLRANARAFARHTVLYKTFGGDVVEQHLLLKYSRVSSIAHEWWHALDHALSFFEKGKNKGPTTEIATGAFDGRQETLEAVRAIMQAIRDSGYTSRIQSHPLYTRDFKNYVLEPTESAARAFAEYMRNKFAENGIAIAGVNEFYDDTQPTAEEMKLITPAIENLFKVLHEKEGKKPGTSILYRLGEDVDEKIQNSNSAENSVPLPMVSEAMQTGEWSEGANNELNKIADDVEQGLAILKRYTPQEHRGLLRGGRLLVEASILSRGSEADIRTPKTGYEGLREKADQTIPVITQWAKANGVWHEYSERSDEEISRDYLDSGTEAQVFNLGNGKVEKIIGLDYYVDPQLALDRIAIHNALFPETNLEVVGFGTNKRGEFAIIVHQQTIAAFPTEQEKINAYIESIGFKLIDDTNHTFINDYLYLSDLHQENVLSNDDKKYYVIDGDFRLNTAEVGVGGNREIDNSIVRVSNETESRKDDIQNAAVDFLVGEPRLRAIENAVNDEAAKLGVKVTYKTHEQMPEGHKNDKGYFDPKTGEVVVCTENASSIADAIQTILHEAVAHKGLRQLMGDAFDEFISRVYDSLDAETKAKVDAIADKHYDGDKAVAMEEYMATLAETTDFADNSVWGKIKSIFEDIINAILGRNDIKIGDNELRYILRASYNNMVNPRGMETIRGWAQDKMMREGYGINNAAKIAEMDAAYMKAVEDGDMETAQRLVLEAAKLAIPNTKVVDENGNPMVVYHGSPYGAITEFDHKKGKTSGLKEFGSFFATNLKVAEMYRDQRELPKELREQIETEIERLRIIQYDVVNSRDYDAIEAEINRLRDALSGKVYATFLNITNPKTFDAKGKDGWAGWHELKQDVGYDVKSGTEAIEAITGNNDAAIMPEQYDGIIAENIADIHSTDDVSDLVGDVFLVWNPSQIKSAEAVTYDDNGNVIPLSKRFNLKSNDIRYRTGIDPDDVARETAKAVYERIVNENWQEFQRQFQDAMQPVRIAIDAIQQETGNLPIEDYENFLLMFNQASSRSRVEIDEFSRRYYSPIIESINEIVNSIIEARGGNTGNKKERAYAYQEIMNYLIAKHGLERNKYYQSTKTRKLTEAEKAKAVSKAQKAYDDAVDAINAMELTDDERADMLAKAQEQFNAELEDIETREVPDMRDYSGLTSLFGFPPKKFKEAEEEAQRLVDDFEKMLGRVDDESGETVTPSEQIEKLWKNINAATSKTLRHSYESGMLSRQQYNDIKDMFKFYIPLRGFNETTAEDVYSYARFEGNRFNPAVHKAKGRTSVADDPIATIMNMAESEIAQGNKNRAKQALYNFLLNRAAGKADQNSLMQVESVWYLKKEDESGKEYYEIAVPNRDAGETYEEFEERMKVLEAEEKAVKSKKGKLNIGMRFQKPANINAHYVFLKVNGVEKAIYINGDPKAAQAINGEHKKKRNELVEKMGALNRFISSMFTNYSLEFTARNYFRDMFYSHINIDVKESDPAYRKKFRQNWRHNNLRSMVKMLKAYRAGEYEGRDLNEDEKAFVEFMRNGGQTGYTLINSVETHKKDLERAIANMQRGIEKGGVKDSTIFKFTLGSIELLNEASELVTRFAAFKTSRDMGRGINTSIADAKEATVNFNTKGAQDGKGFMGMIAHYFGWSKYFFNASVQGVQNLKSMAEANKLKFGSVIGGMIATGFLMPVITSAIASLFGNDDEEYWNIPEYERQNNFCIPIGNGKYVKVPLPIGFREVYAIGDMVAGAAFNKKFTRDLSQVGTDIANKLASIILPINPLESTANGLSVWHTIAYAAAPSSAQFLIQNLTNTDWKGAPLQKEYTYNEDDPQWMKAFASNPDWMKGLSKWCNEHINLDGDYKGMDWSPEQLDNTLSNVFGGIYSLVKKTGKSISMIWNEENRNLSNIPLSGVVLGSGIDNDDRFVTDAYYDMKEYYDSNVNYINRMAKRFGYTLEDVFEKEKGKHHPKMNEIYSNENFDFMQEWYTGVKELDAINDKIKKLDKKIAAKETPTEQDMLKWSRLNDKYMTERRDFVNDMLELD